MKRQSLIVLVTVAFIAGGYFSCRAWQRSSNLSTRIALRNPGAAPAGATLTAAEDWPSRAGPRGDGISREPVADALPGGAPQPVWAADVGIGYSTPVAVNGRVYLFSLNNSKETLTAFDAVTGQIAWSDERTGGWSTDYPGTRSTPVIDGDAILTYGGAGDLICRDLASGGPRWQINVLDAVGAGNMQWGMASSPLVADGRVYVQAGSGGPVAVAADRNTGAIVWQSQARGSGGYAPIIKADVAGTPQLIVFGGDAVFGMDPATGRTIWTVPWKTSYSVNAATPVYRDGQVFVTSSYGMGCMMIEVTPAGARKKWANKLVKSKFQPVVLDGDFLYANSEGNLACLTWADGSRKWRADGSEVELGENGSIVRTTGDKLVTLSDGGKVSVVRATPDGYKVLGSFQAVQGDKVWSSPLLYGGRLYVKGPKELVCFDIAPAPSAAGAGAGGTTQPAGPETRPAAGS